MRKVRWKGRGRAHESKRLSWYLWIWIEVWSCWYETSDLKVHLREGQDFIHSRSKSSSLLKEHIKQIREDRCVTWVIYFIILQVWVPLTYNFANNYVQGITFKRPPESTQLVKNASKHPVIAFVVVLLTHAHLRREVVRCTERCLGKVMCTL